MEGAKKVISDDDEVDGLFIKIKGDIINIIAQNLKRRNYFIVIINCKELSENIRKDIKKRIDNLKNRNINVCLAVILVGDDPASKIYVRK